MSLIEEALRRLQDPLLPRTPITPPSKAPETAPPAHSWSTTPPAHAPQSITTPPRDHALLVVACAVIGLTAVLVIAGAFWMGHAFLAVQLPIRETRSAELVVPSKVVRPASVQQASPTLPPKAETPTTQPQQPVAPQEELALSGVVEGLGEPYAVINGLIVSVGDRIGQATVVGIAHGTVRLKRADGSETVLRTSR